MPPKPNSLKTPAKRKSSTQISSFQPKLSNSLQLSRVAKSENLLRVSRYASGFINYSSGGFQDSLNLVQAPNAAIVPSLSGITVQVAGAGSPGFYNFPMPNFSELVNLFQEIRLDSIDVALIMQGTPGVNNASANQTPVLLLAETPAAQTVLTSVASLNQCQGVWMSVPNPNLPVVRFNFSPAMAEIVAGAFVAGLAPSINSNTWQPVKSDFVNSAATPGYSAVQMALDAAPTGLGTSRMYIQFGVNYTCRYAV